MPPHAEANVNLCWFAANSNVIPNINKVLPAQHPWFVRKASEATPQWTQGLLAFRKVSQIHDVIQNATMCKPMSDTVRKVPTFSTHQQNRAAQIDVGHIPQSVLDTTKNVAIGFCAKQHWDARLRIQPETTKGFVWHDFGNRAACPWVHKE